MKIDSDLMKDLEVIELHHVCKEKSEDFYESGSKKLILSYDENGNRTCVKILGTNREPGPKRNIEVIGNSAQIGFEVFTDLKALLHYEPFYIPGATLLELKRLGIL